MGGSNLPWWFGFPLSGGAWLMGAFPPSFLPDWARLVLFVLGAILFVWGVVGAFWHFRRRDPDTAANDASQHSCGASLAPPLLPDGKMPGSVTATVHDRSTLQMKAETGSTIDFTGARIVAENPAIAAHASDASKILFGGARIGPKGSHLGDMINQHHSGSGDNVVNYGEQPFSMTPDMMSKIAEQLGARSSVVLVAVGSRKSMSAVESLRSFLVGRGKAVTVNQMGSVSWPLAENIEWRDGALYVNADL